MKILIRFLLISVFIIILNGTVRSQTNIIYQGDIIGIDIRDGTLTEFKEITWEQTSIYYGSTFYKAAFHTDSNAYLIQSKILYPDQYPGPFTYTADKEFLININKQTSRFYLGIENYIYLKGFTFYNPYLYRVNNGFWLFYDFLGKAFISNNDNLTTYNETFFTENRLIHIPGQIDSLYVIALIDLQTETGSYYLNDLKNAPDYDINLSKTINFQDDKIVVSGFANLFDSLYILTTNYDYDDIFYTAVYSNDTMALTSSLNVEPNLKKWKYKNERLYILTYDNLLKYDFSTKDTTFINKRVIMTGDMDIDFDQMMSTKFKGDSITVYDMENEITLNTFTLDSLTINKKRIPLIDYPYVYLHRQKSVTFLEQQHRIPEEIHISAYPNPFNNSITFRIDKSEQYIENVTIYNVAGQKVFERAFDASGRIRRATWKAERESSGIYFTRIQTNRSTETKKIVLLK